MSKLTSLEESRRVWYFPYTGALVIAIGAFLHIRRLIVGQDAFVQSFTSNVDLMLFVPMLFTAVCMLVFRKQVDHLRAQIAQSNDFVDMTPWWYSVVLMPWLAVQLYVFLTITVRPSTMRYQLAR